jgi:hypothetical protein
MQNTQSLQEARAGWRNLGTPSRTDTTAANGQHMEAEAPECESRRQARAATAINKPKGSASNSTECDEHDDAPAFHSRHQPPVTCFCCCRRRLTNLHPFQPLVLHSYDLLAGGAPRVRIQQRFIDRQKCVAPAATFHCECIRTSPLSTGLSCITEMRILLMVDKLGPNSLFCMSTRTNGPIGLGDSRTAGVAAHHLKQESTPTAASRQPHMHRAAANASAHDSLHGLPATQASTAMLSALSNYACSMRSMTQTGSNRCMPTLAVVHRICGDEPREQPRSRALDPPCSQNLGFQNSIVGQNRTE